jgi:hypothetical protein
LHRNLYHFVWSCWGFTAFKAVNAEHAFIVHLAKHRVVSVKEAAISEHDEELAVG